jgi:protein Xni
MHALLIDGLNLIRRVHAGVPRSEDVEDGERHRQAVEESCVGSLRRALRYHQPSHAVCAMDHEDLTWRGLLFPDYKKNRQPMPCDLRSTLGSIISRFDTRGVGTVSVPGFEADDVIASIARKVVEAGARVTVLSTDKSFFQLISESVSVYDHFSARDFDDEYVFQRFGVGPGRLVDLFALSGDSSLHISGARGIGLRTAVKLLEEYGDLESILSTVGDIPGSRGKKVRESVDSVRLARRLVALRSDVTIGATLKQFRFDSSGLGVT